MSEIWLYILMFFIGIAAGIINTLAGSGSLLTLSVLIFAGLPASVANTTNRLGILMQGLVAVFQYKRHGKLYWEDSFPILLPTIIGSLAGGWTAINISEQALEATVGIIMIILMLMMFYEKHIKQWQHKVVIDKQSLTQKIIKFVTFLGIGFYGGFIQAGIGLLLFVALAFTMQLEAVRANGIKLLLVLLYTVPVFIFFIFKHPIHWQTGLLLASGQMIGAWYASYYSIKSPNASVWMKRLIIVMAVFTILKMFRLLEF
ncbi:MAG: sulfite exporter TauE/SafE family protein [Flammeovirgaceae bacterium]